MMVLLQVICAFLFAVGSLFMMIDFKTNFDRTFRYFGLSLILLCAMTSIDLWITPGIKDVEQLLYWQRLYHVVACFFMAFSLWYIFLLTVSPWQKYLPGVAFVSLILATLFMSDQMLKADEEGYRGGVLYNWLFVPFVLAYVVASNHAFIRRLRRTQSGERKILILHLGGFLGLCLCGILDMAEVSAVFTSGVASFTIVGVLAYGLMGSLIFAERFVMLLKEKEQSFSKLESAYKDLEQVNALKQLGESTAIINHEIKNYMFMIAGNAQLLQEAEALTDKGRRIADNIVSSVKRLTDFSDDILNLSRTQILKEKHPVNLSEVILSATEKHFPDKRHRFVFQQLDDQHFLFGDWGKLEQVFVNLFKNSFEAGLPGEVEIRVKIAVHQGLLMVIVEDNGSGCDRDQLQGIFKAFYTTKKGRGSTGLGMSITRTIVEGHGGKISAYSKNLSGAGDHGLKVILTFPSYSQSIAEATLRKHPIVVVKEGMNNLTDIIRVFQNVGVSPHIVQDTEDLNPVDFPHDSMTVIASTEAMAARFPKLSAFPRLCLVSRHEGNLYILDHRRSRRPEAFSEEYVLGSLLAQKAAAAKPRMRERQHHQFAA